MQRSSATVLGTKAEKKHQALSAIKTKRASVAGMPRTTHARRSHLCCT